MGSDWLQASTDQVLALALKLLAIAGAGIFLFSLNARPIDPAAVSRLIGPSPSLHEGRH
jgi:hypothetical protein